MKGSAPLLLLAPLCLAMAAASPARAEPVKTAEPPVPRITGLRLLDDTITRLGGNGDNWHTTWAADACSTPACPTASARRA